MKILTWRERHKPGIRAATDPTIAELMQAEIDELRAALKAQPVQPAQWRCFHCDETFTDPTAAREHFGTSIYHQPACQIDIAEYRKMEETHRRHCEEDTDLHREIYKTHGDGVMAAKRAEEAGYARGLADAKKHPEELGLMVAAPVQPVQPAEPGCSDHPDAPHGFNRNASHNAHRYVCDCEGWTP